MLLKLVVCCSLSYCHKLAHGPSWVAHLFLVGQAVPSLAGWFTVQQKYNSTLHLSVADSVHFLGPVHCVHSPKVCVVRLSLIPVTFSHGSCSVLSQNTVHVTARPQVDGIYQGCQIQNEHIAPLLWHNLAEAIRRWVNNVYTMQSVYAALIPMHTA